MCFDFFLFFVGLRGIFNRNKAINPIVLGKTLIRVLTVTHLPLTKCSQCESSALYCVAIPMKPGALSVELLDHTVEKMTAVSCLCEALQGPPTDLLPL